MQPHGFDNTKIGIPPKNPTRSELWEYGYRFEVLTNEKKRKEAKPVEPVENPAKEVLHEIEISEIIEKALLKKKKKRNE